MVDDHVVTKNVAWSCLLSREELPEPFQQAFSPSAWLLSPLNFLKASETLEMTASEVTTKASFSLESTERHSSPFSSILPKKSRTHRKGFLMILPCALLCPLVRNIYL